MQALDLLVHTSRNALQQQRVAHAQLDIAGALGDSLALPCDSNQGQAVIPLKCRLGNRFSKQLATGLHIGCAQRATEVQIIHTEYRMVRVYQAFECAQRQDFFDIARIDQPVSAHQDFIGAYRREDFLIEPHQLNQLGLSCVKQPRLAQLLSNMRIVSRNQQLDRILGCLFEGVFRTLTGGQQPLHRQDRQNANGQAGQAWDRRREEAHAHAGVLCVHAGNDEVRRRTDDGANATQTRSVAERNQQLGGGGTEFVRPFLNDLNEKRYDSRVAEHGTERCHGGHQAHDGGRITLGRSQDLLHDPAQDTGMRQAGHNDKQYADHDDRRGRKTGKCFLLGKHACHKQDGNSPEKGDVFPQAGEQQG